MSINNQESYSFVIVPPTGKNSRSLRVPTWACKLGIALTVCFVILIIMLIVRPRGIFGSNI